MAWLVGLLVLFVIIGLVVAFFSIVAMIVSWAVIMFVVAGLGFGIGYAISPEGFGPFIGAGLAFLTANAALIYIGHKGETQPSDTSSVTTEYVPSLPKLGSSIKAPCPCGSGKRFENCHGLVR